MIVINTVNYHRTCNCCASEDDVLEIIFRSNCCNRGNAVALCKQCRKELKLLLMNDE